MQLAERCHTHPCTYPCVPTDSQPLPAPLRTAYPFAPLLHVYTTPWRIRCIEKQPAAYE